MFWRKSNSTKSEWIMFNIICFLLFICVLYFFRDFFFHSVLLSQDKRLFDAISFAGTVVSIVLGVLAIIYTIFQGFSSQSSSERLAIEIDKLSGVANSSKRQQEKLEASLSGVDSILVLTDKVHCLIESMNEEHRNSLDRIASDVSMVRFQSETLSVKLQEKQEKASTEIQDNAPINTEPTSFTWSVLEALTLVAFLLFLRAKDDRPSDWVEVMHPLKFYADYPELSVRIFSIFGVLVSMNLRFKWCVDGVLDSSILTKLKNPDFIKASAGYGALSSENRELVLKVHSELLRKADLAL
ncbi:hypothetical protein K4H28_08700 [Deefgea tanakiae]|uniref:Uncharacterized protein n=1 Tax=Deefgea tanakiae TaxID=2865840 RepID=A0ABX8Z692_9NEIS|nr:hypothetical protein [Deefgea tanakiae]QZA76429.1 hypothetical protein K4H28_08700 [Deefgea tanakiae]